MTTFYTDLRIDAARASIRLAHDAGGEAARLTAGQRLALRREALGWLRDWLTHPTPDRSELRRLREDPGFVSVRHPVHLAFLPDAEARRWRALWEEMEGTYGEDRAGDTFRSVEEAIRPPQPKRPREVAPPPRQKR